MATRTYLAASANKPKKLRELARSPHEQEILSTTQARKVLGVSFSTLKSYVERGYLSAIWIGDRRFYHRTAIENLIRFGASKPSSANDDTEKGV